MADNPSHPSRVLLVEDEFLICDLLTEVLSERGFDVHAVGNAKDALRHLTGGHPCDVLFTDINLPGGLDGAALAELARELRPNLPVVYASGSVRRIEQFKAVPGASFVPKPYDLDKVCMMLERCVAELSMRNAPERICSGFQNCFEAGMHSRCHIDSGTGEQWMKKEGRSEERPHHYSSQAVDSALSGNDRSHRHGLQKRP